MEKKNRVVTYQNVFICSECNEGEMFPNGIVKPSFPPKFTHECSRCGNSEDLGRVYPYVEYEREEVEA